MQQPAGGVAASGDYGRWPSRRRQSRTGRLSVIDALLDNRGPAPRFSPFELPLPGAPSPHQSLTSHYIKGKSSGQVLVGSDWRILQSRRRKSKPRQTGTRPRGCHLSRWGNWPGGIELSQSGSLSTADQNWRALASSDPDAHAGEKDRRISKPATATPRVSIFSAKRFVQRRMATQPLLRAPLRLRFRFLLHLRLRLRSGSGLACALFAAAADFESPPLTFRVFKR